MSLPVIAVNYFEDENPYCGLPLYVKDMTSCFRVVKEEDVNKDPTLYEQIEGLLSHPGWSFTNPNVIEKLPNLKAVSSVSAGYDHLDVDYLKTRNIRIGNTPTPVANCVADLALALILATSRKLRVGFNVAMGKDEVKSFVNTSPVFGLDVTGKTIGIIGMGGIGLEVAKRCRGFNMSILYHNRNKRDDDHVVNAQFYPSLHDMLPNCDYVLLTCPMTQQTKHLLSDKEFQLMKSTCIIVNVSRGAIIDQPALINALHNRQIYAAGLDVTDPEPLPRDHPLLKLDNVIITPHIGTQTTESRKLMIQLAVDNLKAAIIDKGPMPSEVIVK